LNIVIVNLAVLWDMDGVLVDTAGYHYEAWHQTMQKYGINVSLSDFLKVFGRTTEETALIFLGKTSAEGLIDEISILKENTFREIVRGQASLLPGALTWLDRLSRAGVPQALASSAPQANVDVLVDSTGIRKYFNAVLSESSGPGKPDPSVFVQAAALLKMDRRRCIVIEDSPAGLEAARRAGMKSIAVTTTRPAEVLQAASIIIESLERLSEEILQTLADGTNPIFMI
jgi:beta-phosphoglucomutase